MFTATIELEIQYQPMEVEVQYDYTAGSAGCITGSFDMAEEPCDEEWAIHSVIIGDTDVSGLGVLLKDQIIELIKESVE